MDVRHSAAAIRCAGIGRSIGIAGRFGSCDAPGFCGCVCGCVCCCVIDGVGIANGVRTSRVARLWLACAFVDPVGLPFVGGSIVGCGVLCAITRLLIAA